MLRVFLWVSINWKSIIAISFILIYPSTYYRGIIPSSFTTLENFLPSCNTNFATASLNSLLYFPQTRSFNSFNYILTFVYLCVLFFVESPSPFYYYTPFSCFLLKFYTISKISLLLLLARYIQLFPLGPHNIHHVN